MLSVTKVTDVRPEDLAEMVGVSSAAVSRWEADLRVPKEPTLLRLAQILQVSPAWLRYGDPAHRTIVPPFDATGMVEAPSDSELAQQAKPRRKVK